MADVEALGVGQVTGRVGPSDVARRVLDPDGDRDGQAAGRLAVTGEHRGERLAARHAGEPREQHRSDVVEPREVDRGAGVHHDGRARVGRRDAADELVQLAAEGERAAVEALALDVRIRADHHHRRVGSSRPVQRRRRSGRRPGARRCGCGSRRPAVRAGGRSPPRGGAARRRRDRPSSEPAPCRSRRRSLDGCDGSVRRTTSPSIDRVHSPTLTSSSSCGPVRRAVSVVVAVAWNCNGSMPAAKRPDHMGSASASVVDATTGPPRSAR